MRKIHVVFRKEEIDEDRLGRVVAVVFDVLFATSSIAEALSNGATAVMPVYNTQEALKVAEGLEAGTYVLAGEKNGRAIEGFAYPTPIDMALEAVKGKTVIYTTTNGTVAVRNSEQARQIYTACLLNGDAVAQRLIEDGGDETIVLVCSGTQGGFGLEDFYAAGYLIDRLLSRNPGAYDLTDAALTAHIFFANFPGTSEQALRNTRVGRYISSLGYDRATVYAAQKGILSVVPILKDGRLVVGK